MADNTWQGKAAAWTDKEKLVYIFGLLDASAPKLNWNEAPCPPGRTAVACKLMVSRLRESIKDDLAAMRAGQDITKDGEDAPKTPKTPKRKAKAKSSDEDGGPKKRGRPKKKAVEEVEANKDIKEELELDNEI